MLNDIITQAEAGLEDVFQASEINQAAREAKVVVRTSKMDGMSLLQTLTFGFLQNPQASLSQLCQTAEDIGVEISKQGLDERMTQAAVDFLQGCFSKVLHRLQVHSGLAPEVVKQFSEVYLQDSTVQSVSSDLQELFPGSGGNASPAALKIQVMFGLLSGNLIHLSMQAGRSSDAHYTEHVDCMEKGSLLIQDLGFFNLEALQVVQDRGAFFLMRWRQDVAVSLADSPDLPLDMLRFLSAQTQAISEYDVQVGKTAGLTCRMIVVRLPQEVVDRRRQRLRRAAQRRGNTLSEHFLALCAWNVFITNLSPQQMSVRQLVACYALRWQVELIFKLWKSQAGLRYLAGKRKERVLCEVYAKLIGIAITHFLIAPLRFQFIAQKIEISLPKAHMILQHCARELLSQLGRDHLAFHQLLDNLFHRILRSAAKDKRVKKPSSLQRLALADQLDLATLLPLA
jgi:hypothetical protein